MDEENQNFYITPPTLFLPAEGLRIAILGVDDEWAEQLSDDLETTFPNMPMTFYHLDEPHRNEWQWMFHMIDHCNLIMINVSKLTPLEMMLAALNISNKTWFYVDVEQVDNDIRILLNTINANVFNNAEQLHAMLKNYIGDV